MSRLVLAGTAAALPRTEEIERITRALPLLETDWEAPAVTSIMVDFLAPEANDVARRVLGEFLRRSGSGQAVAGFLDALSRGNVSEQARQIAVPTLVVHARDDRAIPIEAGRALAALIPNVRFEIVEGGHREGTGSTPQVRARVIEFFDEDPGVPVAASK